MSITTPNADMISLRNFSMCLEWDWSIMEEICAKAVSDRPPEEELAEPEAVVMVRTEGKQEQAKRI